MKIYGGLDITAIRLIRIRESPKFLTDKKGKKALLITNSGKVMRFA